MSVQPIPEGYHTLTTYLTVENAAEAIEFYKNAFGAEETMRMPTPEGRIAHAELRIGDSLIMLSDPFPQSESQAPTSLGGTTGGLFMYCADVDAAIGKAVDAGATVTMPAEDMFWGDRFGTVRDPYGHIWSIATHTRDLTPEEIAEGAKAAMSSS